MLLKRYDEKSYVYNDLELYLLLYIEKYWIGNNSHKNVNQTLSKHRNNFRCKIVYFTKMFSLM